MSDLSLTSPKWIHSNAFWAVLRSSAAVSLCSRFKNCATTSWPLDVTKMRKALLLRPQHIDKSKNRTIVLKHQMISSHLWSGYPPDFKTRLRDSVGV